MRWIAIALLLLAAAAFAGDHVTGPLSSSCYGLTTACSGSVSGGGSPVTCLADVCLADTDTAG